MFTCSLQHNCVPRKVREKNLHITFFSATCSAEKAAKEVAKNVSAPLILAKLRNISQFFFITVACVLQLFFQSSLD